MRDRTLGLDHFERLYQRSPDPWQFASSAYEAAKYAATLAALPQTRYASGLDVGCSIGVLTQELAGRCDALVGIEPVEAALEEARRRNAGLAHVRFEACFVPAQWPAERFDLVVVSEVLDYLGPDDLGRLASRLEASLRSGGDLVLVHWVGKKGALVQPGESTDVLAAGAAGFLEPLTATRNADYRLDVFRRR